MSHPVRAAYPLLESENAPIYPAFAMLIARDAEALARFYVEKLGFSQLADDGANITLGADSTTLLHIRRAPQAKPHDPRSSGLFHIAYLVPDRASLARWFLAARAAGVPFEGASDHAVSEAFYLTDPEGNGIEVYVDRPRAAWPRDAQGYAMTTGPMALRDLTNEAGEAIGTPRLPAGTRVGHVHLQVGDVEVASRFYRETLGLDVTHRRPQAFFLSWGGYHHHIGLNSWQSRGAGPLDPAMAGLAEITFNARDGAMMTALSEKAGLAVSPDGHLKMVAPDGLILNFRPA